MLIYFFLFYPFFLGIDCFSRKSSDFNCTDFPSGSAGDSLFIPYNSPDPVILPSNFSCSYQINVKHGLWTRIRVNYELIDPLDYIIIDDGLSHKTIIRNSKNDDTFYFIQNSAATITIHSAESSEKSKLLINLEFFELPSAKTMRMTNVGRVNFLDLNDVLQSPITVVGDQMIVGTLARSGATTDDFSSYFIFDGDLLSYENVSRLDDFSISQNIYSKRSLLTIVGLSNRISRSVMIFQNTNDVSSFDDFSAVTVIDSSRTISIESVDRKSALTFIAPNNESLMLESLKYTDIEDETCHVIIISGSPSNFSKTLVDYSPSSEFSLPQLFPASFFTLIVWNCSIQVQVTSKIDIVDYYKVGEEKKKGYIFSPSYLDSQASPFFNITYFYNSTLYTKYSIFVEDIQLPRNGELDINILSTDYVKSMSLVVTGSENGAKSRADGNYLNVQLISPSNVGYAKIQFEIDPNSSSKIFRFEYFVIFMLISLFL